MATKYKKVLVYGLKLKYKNKSIKVRETRKTSLVVLNRGYIEEERCSVELNPLVRSSGGSTPLLKISFMV
jgi:hypothetical protein